MNTMKVRFINPMVTVTIAKNSEVILEKTFLFGYNIAYSRDCITETAPFIGDVLRDLVETYDIDNDGISYSGYRVFRQQEMTAAEVAEMVNPILDNI